MLKLISSLLLVILLYFVCDSTINFNAESLANGIYFYRINSGEFSQTNKLILTR
ncbi:MAG: hypothetical protein STSR0008_24370 [Ignavibacterium sp.]